MIETRFVDVDGARLSVHLRGETARGLAHGGLALFVHGYPLDARMWLDAMRSPLGELRALCAVDLRGHGQSAWNGDEAHTMERFADDLAAIARTLSDDPVDVVALSMGGYAALAFAERHPQLVRTLALVDTKATADTDAAKEGRLAAARGVVEHGRRWLCEQMLQKLVPADAPAFVRARLQSMIERTPVETILADLKGMAQRPDRTQVLRHATFPVLACAGALDALTPPSDARAMAEATGARGSLAIVDGAGHMLPMEKPAEFAAAIAAFWRAH